MAPARPWLTPNSRGPADGRHPRFAAACAGRLFALAACLWVGLASTAAAQGPRPYGAGAPYARGYRTADDPAPPRDRFGSPARDRQRREQTGPPPRTDRDFAAENRAAADRRAPAVRGQLFEPAKIIAVVGDQYILAGDLMGAVEMALAPYKDQFTEEQMQQQRMRLLRQALKQSINTKLLFQDFMRTGAAERMDVIQQKVNEQFNTVMLPKLLENEKVETAAQLDAKMRARGTSLQKQQRMYAEQLIAGDLLRHKIDREPEVTRQEMWKEYQRTRKEYYRPAKARWEKLSVLFENYPSRYEAKKAIAAMGNEVLGGAPLAAVARRRSQGVRADKGGLHDWITKGSLASKELDAAIFSLPPGRLSRIIEDRHGYHIVRVVERVEEGYTPFVEAQVAIKKKLKQKKINAQVEEYLSQVKKNTPVWTIFDDQTEEESSGKIATGASPGERRERTESDASRFGSGRR